MDGQRLAFAELLEVMSPQTRRKFRRKRKWTARQEKKHIKELRRHKKEEAS